MSRLHRYCWRHMTNVTCCGWICALLLCAMATAPASTPQTTEKPLKATRLLALAAGDALSENVVTLVKTPGLAFKPSEQYLKQLAEAGANVQVLNVVSKPTVHIETEGQAEDTKQEPQILAHL